MTQNKLFGKKIVWVGEKPSMPIYGLSLKAIIIGVLVAAVTFVIGNLLSRINYFLVSSMLNDGQLLGVIIGYGLTGLFGGLAGGWIGKEKPVLNGLAVGILIYTIFLVIVALDPPSEVYVWLLPIFLNLVNVATAWLGGWLAGLVLRSRTV